MPFVRAVRLAALLLLIGTTIRPAVAQQSLKRSEPAAGARLAAPPHELRLTFSERVEMALSGADVIGPAGKQVRLDGLRLARGAPSILVVTLSEILGPGEYAVIWEVAGPDGHLARGRFTFVIVDDTTRMPPGRLEGGLAPDRHQRPNGEEAAGFRE